ncbi:MAG: hypothetical protein E7473_07465 [Ruminococcaceae bacterium]|nr:hypothetical protein [Oscillospiraceae bacterium]
MLKRMITTIVTVFLLSALLCSCSSSISEGADSPEAAVENYLNAYMEADSEGIIKTLPPQIAEPFVAINEEKTEEMNKSIKSALGEEENSYEIKDKVKMTDKEKERYEKRLTSSAAEYAQKANLKSFNPEIKIEEAYNVTVALRNGGNRSEAVFPTGKINGEWYVLRDNPVT